MIRGNDPVQFSSGAAQRIVEATRWVEGQRRSQLPRRGQIRNAQDDRETTTSVWAAEIVRTGPEGTEPDYTDNRYWVRKLALPAPGESWDEAEPDPDGPWTTAYNLDELGGTPHAIWREVPGVVHPTSRRFALIHQFEQDGETHYVFIAYPGQRIPVKAYIPTHCDQNGCPVGSWVLLNGPAYVEETDCEELP